MENKTMTLALAQYAVKQLPHDQVGEISDGYHTFNELYKHRITLWITVCRLAANDPYGVGRPWRAIKHSDDSVWDGWFLLGLGKMRGEQMTYHLPLEMWDECKFAETLDKAPAYDGHSSEDVLKRLKDL